MNRGLKQLVAAFVATGLVGAAMLAPSGPTVAATGETPSRGSVVLLRGLGNVFSLGLDDIGSKLRKQGVQVKVENHSAWTALANDIETRYAADKKSALPVIIMGHSWGANAALLMANELGKDHIPVDLVVTFDATSDIRVPANVRHAVNFYYPPGVGKELKPAGGFRGKLENIDVSKLKLGIDHLIIEKNEQLQAQVIPEVVKLVGRRR
jgi:pimeloyl-ACP methyl ester carboxylesterase